MTDLAIMDISSSEAMTALENVPASFSAVMNPKSETLEFGYGSKKEDGIVRNREGEVGKGQDESQGKK
jgi:hypothetical protein